MVLHIYRHVLTGSKSEGMKEVSVTGLFAGVVDVSVEYEER